MTRKGPGLGLVLILVIGTLAGLYFTGNLRYQGGILSPNQWASFDPSGTVQPYSAYLDCIPGAAGYCWSTQAANGESTSVSKTVTIPGGRSLGTGVASVGLATSASSACSGGTGWQISNACAFAQMTLGGGWPGNTVANPCGPNPGSSNFSVYIQWVSCVTSYFGGSTYKLNFGMLPAKLLGQDNNFTSTFGDACSTSSTAACASSSQCPSSAPTGCQTLVRTGNFQGRQVTITDLIYTFGLDLRIGFVGAQPSFYVSCAGYGITTSGFTNGPCAGAIVSALQAPATDISGFAQTSGKIVIAIQAPFFAYSSSYDYYGLWNAYIAQKACFGTGSSNIAPCGLGGHTSLLSQTVTYKDPSQWTPTDFANLPTSLPQSGKITLAYNSLGPTYTIKAVNPNGTDSNCNADLNSGMPSASTCQLSIQGASLIEIPIIFQEIAQATVTSTGTGSSGTCSAGNYTVTGCRSTSNSTLPPPGSNVGNVTRTFQNYTSPYWKIVVKVSDTSGFLGFLVPLGGMIITLNPIGSTATTNSSGVAVFSGLSPPTGNTQYSVFAVDPGGFFIVPPNHVTPSPTVNIPNQGTGIYLVSITMTTSWAGLIVEGVIGFVIIVFVFSGVLFGFVRFAPRQSVAVYRGVRKK